MIHNVHCLPQKPESWSGNSLLDSKPKACSLEIVFVCMHSMM